MKTFLSILMLIAGITFYAKGAEEVLLWQTTESTTVDGGDIFSFLEIYPIDEDNWNAVRVVVTGGQLSEPIYLPIYFDLIEEDGEFGVELMDNGSGYWGVGNPTGIQSKFPVVDEMLFQLEMGHNVWDYNLDDAVWTTIAVSDTATYEYLRQQYIYETFDIAPQTAKPWNPNFHVVVPEPNTNLLLLFGLSILLLKRKSTFVVK